MIRTLIDEQALQCMVPQVCRGRRRLTIEERFEMRFRERNVDNVFKYSWRSIEAAAQDEMGGDKKPVTYVWQGATQGIKKKRK